MLIDALLYLQAFVLNFFFSLVQTLMLPLPSSWTFSASESFGYVFGNIFLLNELLPVTSFFILLSLALTFHISMFSLKVVFFMMDVTAKVYRFFVSVRG